MLLICLPQSFADVLYLNEGEELIGNLNKIDNDSISFTTLKGEAKNFTTKEVAHILISKIRKGDEIKSVSEIKDKVVLSVLKNMPDPRKFTNSDYITLFKKRKFEFISDNKVLYTRRELVQVLKEPGLDKANKSIYYLKEREKSTLNFAHTYSPDGKVFHITDDAISNESLYSATPEYAKLSKIKMALKKVDLGGIIDYSYSQEISDISILKPFSIDRVFGEREPVLKEELEVIYPSSLSLQIEKFQWPENPNLKFEQKQDAKTGKTVLKASFSDPKGFIPEQNMFPIDRIFPRLVIFQVYKWQDMANSLMAAYKKAAPSEEKLAKLIETAKLTDQMTDFDKAAQLYELINKEIRPIGMSIGDMGSYEPVSGDITLTKKYGNRQAKLAILYFALAKLEIPAEIGFTSGKREVTVTEKYPNLSLAGYPVLKVKIDGKSIYTDGGSVYRPFGTLSTSLQGGKAVFFASDKASFEELPRTTSDWNRFDRNVLVKMQDDGSMDVKEILHFRGPFEVGLRELKAAKEREKKMYAEQRVKRVHPNATLKSFALSDVTNLQAPVVMTLNYHIKEAAQKASDNIMTFTNFWVNYQSSSASLSKRKFPMQYWATEENSQTIIFELPKGFKWVPWNKQYHYSSGQLTFLSNMHQNQSLLIYSDRFTAQKDEFAANQEYEHYRKCILTMSELANQWIIIEKEATKTKKPIKKTPETASPTIDINKIAPEPKG
jgi:hypothetical protein